MASVIARTPVLNVLDVPNDSDDPQGLDSGPVIDPMDRTPLYVQIADELAEQIRTQQWEPGRQLPSEKAIQQRYGVSRGTARRAVAELVERELVVTVPQRGTYVRADD